MTPPDSRDSADLGERTRWLMENRVVTDEAFNQMVRERDEALEREAVWRRRAETWKSLAERNGREARAAR